jgi:hypothetical protein
MEDKPIAVAVGVIGTPDYPALKEKLGDEAYSELLDLLKYWTSRPEEKAKRLERDAQTRGT